MLSVPVVRAMLLDAALTVIAPTPAIDSEPSRCVASTTAPAGDVVPRPTKTTSFPGDGAIVTGALGSVAFARIVSVPLPALIVHGAAGAVEETTTVSWPADASSRSRSAAL